MNAADKDVQERTRPRARRMPPPPHRRLMQQERVRLMSVITCAVLADTRFFSIRGAEIKH